MSINITSKNLVFDRTLQYDIAFMIIFCIVGLFIKYFFKGSPTQDGSSGPASAAIWGYGFICLSMLVILFISFGLANKLANIEDCGFLKFMKHLFFKSFAPSVLILILIWNLVLNVKYGKIINRDIVPHEYNVADTILSVMIFAQIIIILKYVYNLIVNTKFNPSAKPCGIEYEDTGLMKGLTMISVFIGLISAVLLGIMNIILAFYITDG